MEIYNNVLELIGHTPIVRLAKIEKEYQIYANRLFAKLEFCNPGSSAKDRIALRMVEDALAQGRLNNDSVIIEPTSGNTGIGLAMVAKVKGLRAIIVMPDTMSKERINLMKAYGEEVVLTDGSKGMQGAIDKANELAKDIPNSFIPGQFDNLSNPLAHYDTTGPEICTQMDGQVDIFIAGVGTGGTITGVGKFLKKSLPNVQVIAVEPESSPVLSKGTKGAHKIQGIGAGFVPHVLDTKIYDEVITVSNEDAYKYAKVARTEGLLVGISSGAALCAAIKVASRKENQNKNIVVLLPDTGERYLSVDGFID